MPKRLAKSLVLAAESWEMPKTWMSCDDLCTRSRKGKVYWQVGQPTLKSAMIVGFGGLLRGRVLPFASAREMLGILSPTFFITNFLRDDSGRVGRREGSCASGH